MILWEKMYIIVEKYIGKFYALPLNSVLGIMVFLLMIWIVFGVAFRNRRKMYKGWKIFNIMLCIFSLLLIIKMTLWGRSVRNKELELYPFYTLTTISYNMEAIRTLLMNIILFFPFGLTVPYVVETIPIKRNKCRCILCILSGFIISVTIESLQYYFGIGRAETDDVICNTLGCALGVLAYVVQWKWRKVKSSER